MVNKSILTKNYYIDPEAVAELGAEIESVMTETDRAMEEASEIIAEIASLTERVPSEIRCGALLEVCAAAQEEIRSFDFLSYGKRVNQGLQNLIDHNQYITENFIKNMRANTERMHGLGEEFRRLADSITYSGEGVQPKGIKLSTDGNAETANTDGEEENLHRQGHGQEAAGTDMTGWNAIFPRAGAAVVLDAEIDESTIGEKILSNYMIQYGIGNDEKIEDFINWIRERRPDLLQQLYISNKSSVGEAGKVLDEIFNEIVNAQNAEFNDIYHQYNLMITVEDVDSMKFTEKNGFSSSLNDVQKETFAECWNMLVGMGFSIEQIIGVMANLYDEGKFSPTNVEDGRTESLEIGVIDDSLDYIYDFEDGIGYGICQWTYFTRKEGLLNMAIEMNGSVSDLDVQLAYLKWELENWKIINTNREDGGYTLEDFLKLDTVEDATTAFMIHFENPDPSCGQRRLDFAVDIQNWYSTIQ